MLIKTGTMRPLVRLSATCADTLGPSNLVFNIKQTALCRTKSARPLEMRRTLIQLTSQSASLLFEEADCTNQRARSVDRRAISGCLSRELVTSWTTSALAAADEGAPLKACRCVLVSPSSPF